MPQTSRRITAARDDAAELMAAERALFSEFLVSARQRARCSIDDIALVTKVPARHLEALEQGRVDELPRGVYRRAIVRTYSAAVGLDAALVLERFAQVFGSDTAFSEWQMVPAPVRSRSTALARQSSPAASAPTLVTPRRVAPGATTIRSKQDRLRARIAAVVVVAAVLASATAYWALRFDGSSGPARPTPSAKIDRAPGVATTVPAVTDRVPQATPVLAAASSPLPAPVRRAAAADVVAPSAEQPAASADTDMRLLITSDPSGARVTVDGVGWGVTPITIRHLSPGVKVIRVTKDGYVGQQQEVRLGEAGPVAAQLTLSPRN